MPAMVLPPAYNSPQRQEQQDRDEYLSQEPLYGLYTSLPRNMTGFELLPEAHVGHVLGLLPLSERIRSAELVSKQWRKALRDQEALAVLDLSADPAWRCQVSKKLLEHLIARSMRAFKTGIQSSPTKKIILTDCKLVCGAGPPMAVIETCLKQCAHLEVIEATGFGGIEGAFHMNDLLSLLRTLNRMRPSPQAVGAHMQVLACHFRLNHCQCKSATGQILGRSAYVRPYTDLSLQLKEIWVDAWCPCLSDTWESTAYQRAIAVDALWLTFMRMLEPTSRIKVRNIICTESIGDRLRPSELQRSLNMRLQNLWTAVARSSHSIQVLFAVHTPAEVEAVNKAMARRRGVQCMPVLEQIPATHQGNVHYFKLSK